MPTKREREYYQLGFRDGAEYFKEGGWSPEFGERITTAIKRGRDPLKQYPRGIERFAGEGEWARGGFRKPKPKRKLSAWNKFVKANSKKPRFRYRNGKLNLKKMAVAFRKSPAGKKRKR